MGQYSHLFVTDMVDAATDYVNEGEAVDEAGRPANVGRPWRLMARFDVPPATVYVGVSWIHVTSDEALWVHTHVHEDSDEVLYWIGTDPDNPNDLGGEAYFELGGERHLLTTTTAVFIPRHHWHCPLGWNHVERGFRFISMDLNPTYESFNDKDLAAGQSTPTPPPEGPPPPGTFDHLFIKDAAVDAARPGPGGAPGYALMTRARVPETTIQATYSWVGPQHAGGAWDHPDVHPDSDELLVWLGGDPADEKALGAELTVEIEDERHTVTTTGAVFIPKGLRHRVLGADRITRPFTFIHMALDRYQG
ncbi:MAG: hypothetical protein LBR27_02725 [Bifidobacteriaceae bacterium]|jgi:mannose-6-phosphate isomerase-like protein (cupin superfamily)|nr:hypothetical protein [Bifidobacteriaceae bacterium]